MYPDLVVKSRNKPAAKTGEMQDAISLANADFTFL